MENSGVTKIEEACQNLRDYLNTSEIKQEDSHYQCKKKLQMYTKRKKLGEPVYHSKRKSSSRDLHFEATVTVAGELFKSPGAYKTAEKAEDAVAQHALMTLVTVAFQKSNTGNYKSFLQELAQHEGLCLPEYKTIRIGEPRNLTFFSSVEFEGEVFHGNASKSKKQAEENAAKVAYMALAKCKSFHTSDPLTVSSDLEDEEKEDEEMVHSKHTSAQSIGAEKFNASSLLHELSVNENSPSSMESMFHLHKETISSSATTPTHSSTVSNANSSAGKTAETKSYLLCNRVRVYKSIPDEVFPKGTVALPIGEDKWVVVNLEFPSEKV
nr:double-stranded RNA-binding protein 4-like [Nicotiana tomentosiformis]